MASFDYEYSMRITPRLEDLTVHQLRALLDITSESIGLNRTYIYLSSAADKNSLIKCLQNIRDYEKVNIISLDEEELSDII